MSPVLVICPLADATSNNLCVSSLALIHAYTYLHHTHHVHSTHTQLVYVINGITRPPICFILQYVLGSLVRIFNDYLTSFMLDAHCITSDVEHRPVPDRLRSRPITGLPLAGWETWNKLLPRHRCLRAFVYMMGIAKRLPGGHGGSSEFICVKCLERRRPREGLV